MNKAMLIAYLIMKKVFKRTKIAILHIVVLETFISKTNSLTNQRKTIRKQLKSMTIDLVLSTRIVVTLDSNKTKWTRQKRTIRIISNTHLMQKIVG